MPPNHIELLRKILEVCPDLLYVEQIKILVNLVGVDYSIYELRDAQRRLKMTRKGISFMPMELDPLLRTHFLHLIRRGGPFRAKMIRAIDESHAVVEGVMRLLGLAPIGIRAFQRIFKRGGRSEGCSAILSMTIEGVRSVHVYDTAAEGNINCDVFEREFLDVILPQMNPYPGDDSVTLCDGASVHNKHRIFAACQAVGVICIFLYPYGFAHNPCELVFGASKNRMKILNPHSDVNKPLVNFFRECLTTTTTAEMACNFFEHCDIHVTPDEREWATR
jgi:hypothetical protein